MFEVLYDLAKFLNKDEKFIVSVSGGVDSMVLLNLLSKYTQSKNNVHVVHFHHGLRKQSDQEFEAIKKLCDQEGYYFKGVYLSFNEKSNFQSEARDKRYKELSTIASDLDIYKVFLGQHGDDQIETILMRIIRGTTLRGSSGISKVKSYANLTLIRPLLDSSKEDIYKYAKDHHITYFEDESNRSDSYFRNRIRNNVIPIIKNENPNVVEAFSKFHTTVLEAADYIESQMKHYYHEVIDHGKMNLKILFSYDIFVRKQMIEMFVSEQLQENIQFINNKHINQINDLIYAKTPNGEVHLPKGIRFIKSYNYVYFACVVEHEEYFIPFNHYVKLWDKFEFMQIDNLQEVSNDIIRLNTKEICMPLYVRNRKNGDRIQFLGSKGSKKIKNIMIDHKIPAKNRTLWPILVDSCGKILWVPGLKKSGFDKKVSEDYDIVLKLNYID